MEIEISVITVNYNGLKDTCELIDSITFSNNMEVIVVDNGSHEDEATVIELLYPNVIVIRSNKNLGFAGGNNLGIKAAKGKYLFLINNDTFLDSHFDTKQLTERLESRPEVAIVCPKIRFSWSNRPIQFAGYTKLSAITLRNRAIGCCEEDNGQYDIPNPTPYAHGAAMLIKREAMEKVGLMPECYFLYYEELDWSLMFTRNGYKIWYDPACVIYHKESQTTGQDSPLRTYYITRNRLLFARRNIPYPRRLLTYIYIICVVGTRDVMKHLLCHHSPNAKATLKGIVHFIRNRQGKEQ